MKNKIVVLDEIDSALDAFCMSRGTSIVFIDEQLAALPDDNVNKRELLRLRTKVKEAHRRKDFEALDGWLHALMIGLKAAVHTIPRAVTGEKFIQGRKPNTGTPIRKAIARELKKNPNLKPRELWLLLASKPPKGWAFCDNDLGKYIEGPREEGMKYSRFSAVCKEERDKLNQ